MFLLGILFTMSLLVSVASMFIKNKVAIAIGSVAIAIAFVSVGIMVQMDVATW